MFRNQTDYFKKKGRGVGAKFKQPNHEQPGSTQMDIVSQRTTSTPPGVMNTQTLSGRAISCPIVPSLEEQATCYFFHNYVPHEPPEYIVNFSYLADVYAKELVNKSLDNVLVSVGMAGLANIRKAPEILTRARLKYTSALPLISQSLRNIDEAKADQTLISVLLLGLWEVSSTVLPGMEICSPGAR